MNRFDDYMRQLYMPFPAGRIKPASEAEILLLEKEIGHPLPEEYREFLGAYGGAFIASGFPIPTETRNGEEYAYVASMFGICAGDGYDVFHSYRMQRSYLPPELLTIASCENGYICLAVFGDKKGSVYFHNSREGGDDYDSMY